MNEYEAVEYRRAVAALTEWDYAPYTDPETYADIMAPDGTRL